MSTRRESSYDALKRKLNKIEKLYEKTPEAAVVKRGNLERQAEKIERQLEAMREANDS